MSVKKLFYRIVAKYALCRPEMAELLEVRYATPSSFIKTGLNRLCYLAKSSRVFAVTSVTLELCANCNLQCTICPVNRGMKRKKGFMSFELVKKILNENRGLVFVLLYHWGESLLHPELYKIIRFVKSQGVMTFLTTNGVLLNQQNIVYLIESGLDRVTISMDGTDSYYEKIRGFPYYKLKENILNLIEERNRRNSHLKIDVDMTVTEENEEDVKNFRKEWLSRVDMLRIHPFVYVMDKKGTPQHARCNEVWRGNLIVLWDGKVVPCCVDYEGELIMGDVNRNTLKEIINGQNAVKLRRALLTNRFPALCRTCGEYQTEEVNPRFFDHG